ncbi:MAG: hypothetical protein MAG551_01175 [Candidatus Scalindua arabica]|uniref:Uncharacterized protein n=1 Tax=Candidatus Scalindua arabica TaxID=1127984 RepID=A0A942A4L6_9BACT|nr:hypothetical protein [Candidatus Scalindua arabica]
MTTVHEIEKAVSALPSNELEQFRKWFDEFDAKVWDKQFESDVRSGKLDQAAENALADFDKGKAKEL